MSEPTMNVNQRIQSILDSHPVVLFMKGTPQFPMCEFSSRAVGALHEVAAVFHAVNVQEDPELRAGLPRFANCSTFPQLYVQGELIGGCDIVLDLHASGELKRLVREAHQTDA